MPNNGNLWALGHKLNKLRLNRGYTLQEAADAIGLTASFLSMVENGRSGISFTNLQKLLGFYGASFADIAEKKDPQGRVVRLEQARPLDYRLEGVESLLLVEDTLQHFIEPIYFRLQPGASIGYAQHDGEEFSFVIEGTIGVSLINPDNDQEESYVLEKGDSIYYSSRFKHRYVNMSSRVSIFLATVIRRQPPEAT